MFLKLTWHKKTSLGIAKEIVEKLQLFIFNDSPGRNTSATIREIWQSQYLLKVCKCSFYLSIFTQVNTFPYSVKMQSIFFPAAYSGSKRCQAGQFIPQGSKGRAKENKNANHGAIQRNYKILFQKQNKSFVSILMYFTHLDV